MRKRTISHLFDTIMWYIIYLLPLILTIISWRTSGNLSISSIMTTAGFEILSTNLIFTSLSALFGSTGIFPIFNSTDILMYMSYFVSIMIIHLAVDVLLFIVRLSHNWLEGICGGNHD